MTFTADQRSVINGLAVATATPSMIGCVFVMFCYYKFKDLRNHAFTLVLFMATCDFFSSVFRSMGDTAVINDGLCQFQAWGTSFFETSSILWSLLIAFTLHMAFLLEKDSFSSNKIGSQMWKYHLVGWGYPLVMSILPFTTKSFGSSGAWCWVTVKDSTDHIGIFWRYMQFYGVLWLVMGYACFVYIRVLLKIKRMGSTNADESKANRKLMRRIMYYPAVLILCWWAGSVNRIVELICCQSFGLTVCQLLFSGLFGFFNSLVYGMTPVVKAHLKNLFFRERMSALSEDDG